MANIFIQHKVTYQISYETYRSSNHNSLKTEQEGNRYGAATELKKLQIDLLW